MHPAFSIVFFTTASGIGYGILGVAGFLAIFGLLPSSPILAFAAMALALALVSPGLLASFWHLGRPERAWRALSQWRTSWLSREGVMAIVTYAPAFLFGLVWLLSDGPSLALGLLGFLALLSAAVTVGCTAMIYASLVPIHQWHNRWVAPNYLALSAMSGALWLTAVTRLWAEGSAFLDLLAMALVVMGWLLKEAYWRFIATTSSPSTIESATGLGRYGKVRAFEAPHTEENYLLKEMGYRIGRKHAARLRNISRLLAFVLPLVLTGLALFLTGSIAAAACLLAAILASFGVYVERWLFFAEAKHTVTLYYGYDHGSTGVPLRPSAAE